MSLYDPNTYNRVLTKNTKVFPGGEVLWDILTPIVFKYALACGLKEESKVLDVGCGSLRVGRHLILFLKPNKYTGLEPEREMVELGLKEPPLCDELLRYKQPTFIHNSEFELDNNRFDFVLAHQVFHHCGEEQLKQFLTNLRPRLNGSLLLTVYIEDENKIYDKSNDERYFTYKYASHGTVIYSKDYFVKLTESLGYQATQLCGPTGLNDTYWRLI